MAPSAPIIIGALTWPMWAMRKALPESSPMPTPTTTPHCAAAVVEQGLGIAARAVRTVVTELLRSAGSVMFNASAPPSAHRATARRVASASSAWRRTACGRPSANSMSSALRRAKSRCWGGVPPYFW